jgi:hypothetical protein
VKDYAEEDFYAPHIPKAPVPVLIFANFSITLILTAYETLVTPMTSTFFGWEVAGNSLLFLVIGGVVFVTIMVAGVRDFLHSFIDLFI